MSSEFLRNYFVQVLLYQDGEPELAVQHAIYFANDPGEAMMNAMEYYECKELREVTALAQVIYDYDDKGTEYISKVLCLTDRIVTVEHLEGTNLERRFALED